MLGHSIVFQICYLFHENEVIFNANDKGEKRCNCDLGIKNFQMVNSFAAALTLEYSIRPQKLLVDTDN